MSVPLDKLQFADNGRIFVQNTGFGPEAVTEMLRRLSDWATGERDAPFILVIVGDSNPGSSVVIDRLHKFMGPPDVSLPSYAFRLGEPVRVLARELREPTDGDSIRVVWIDVESIGLAVHDDPRTAAVKAFWSLWTDMSPRDMEGFSLKDSLVVLQTRSGVRELESNLVPALGEERWNKLRGMLLELLHASSCAVVRGIRADLNLSFGAVRPGAFVDTTAEVDLLLLRALEAGANPGWLGLQVEDELRSAMAGVDELPTKIRLDISMMSPKQEELLAQSWSRNEASRVPGLRSVFKLYEV